MGDIPEVDMSFATSTDIAAAESAVEANQAQRNAGTAHDIANILGSIGAITQQFSAWKTNEEISDFNSELQKFQLDFERQYLTGSEGQPPLDPQSAARVYAEQFDERFNEHFSNMRSEEAKKWAEDNMEIFKAQQMLVFERNNWSNYVTLQTEKTNQRVEEYARQGNMAMVRSELNRAQAAGVITPAVALRDMDTYGRKVTTNAVLAEARKIMEEQGTEAASDFIASTSASWEVDGEQRTLSEEDRDGVLAELLQDDQMNQVFRQRRQAQVVTEATNEWEDMISTESWIQRWEETGENPLQYLKRRTDEMDPTSSNQALQSTYSAYARRFQGLIEGRRMGSGGEAKLDGRIVHEIISILDRNTSTDTKLSELSDWYQVAFDSAEGDPVAQDLITETYLKYQAKAANWATFNTETQRAIDQLNSYAGTTGNDTRWIQPLIDEIIDAERAGDREALENALTRTYEKLDEDFEVEQIRNGFSFQNLFQRNRGVDDYDRLLAAVEEQGLNRSTAQAMYNVLAQELILLDGLNLEETDSSFNTVRNAVLTQMKASLSNPSAGDLEEATRASELIMSYAVQTQSIEEEVGEDMDFRILMNPRTGQPNFGIEERDANGVPITDSQGNQLVTFLGQQVTGVQYVSKVSGRGEDQEITRELERVQGQDAEPVWVERRVWVTPEGQIVPEIDAEPGQATIYAGRQIDNIKDAQVFRARDEHIATTVEEAVTEEFGTFENLPSFGNVREADETDLARALAMVQPALEDYDEIRGRYIDFKMGFRGWSADPAQSDAQRRQVFNTYVDTYGRLKGLLRDINSTNERTRNQAREAFRLMNLPIDVIINFMRAGGEEL